MKTYWKVCRKENNQLTSAYTTNKNKVTYSFNKFVTSPTKNGLFVFRTREIARYMSAWHSNFLVVKCHVKGKPVKEIYVNQYTDFSYRNPDILRFKQVKLVKG